LPLSLLFVKRLVLALVPCAYIQHPAPHRASYFLDHIWSEQRGLLVHVIGPHNHRSGMSWLLLFPNRAARESVLRGRFGPHVTELLWHMQFPRNVAFSRDTVLLHSDVVGQRQRCVRAGRRKGTQARRGGVAVSELPSKFLLE
jgi:hypothetical protein